MNEGFIGDRNSFLDQLGIDISGAESGIDVRSKD